jgi:hypothetical protein
MKINKIVDIIAAILCILLGIQAALIVYFGCYDAPYFYMVTAVLVFSGFNTIVERLENK